ncbi:MULTISPECIES: 50S ribosomal protein L11 methyltransferase [Leuconostoc]|jgi:ribosomal protein L11 methyltransferase|uniref:50S ribosomal protein L11 methyltransferase n=1 Tax=Leuconostoc TaxID=1243 RepID=UPI0011DDE8B6|nr:MULTISPECIES: 50S ribosomal protein L11 methyltransferase [Leuconostoc]MBK0039924.1 50S ribosomal protein L11 methyltransferase [Leuconostoc sp. S51]MBK0050883.1 50S ribosomal protein L11 methyltransferase [Leuconostoc sp. S50]MBS0956958.1 50S ribosomal protein L11 methyltransferase [Leuconostoc pseudomesenteroides]MCT4381310.1 50S ribosomal protein L11 methyltransferase [Leuconostoc pseudomesenteroides]MCT4412491.1 50S ribosomal protein L11 methyltransferase [Leuconostoc pseudomesenteroide
MTKNNWQAVTIATQNEAVESVADILRTVGADGVQIVDDQVPVKVIAYFENNEQLSATLNKIQSQLNELQRYDIDATPGTVTVAGVAQSEWENEWKSYYHATRITRHLTVVPSWEQYLPEQQDEYPIIMDPKLAFGTGTHETTRLMLQALETVIRGGESMIDVGTGSGVLAVAAKQLGADTVLATDIDESAVEVAQANLILNPVAKNVTVTVSDLLESVDSTVKVDLVVANILADVIERLIPQVANHLTKDGYFLVSGIYDDIAPQIIDQLHISHFEICEHMIMGKWHAFIATQQTN